MEQFGKFKILEELGRGGMGAVYRARDTELGREVALKVILEDVLDVAEVKNRFRREAQSLAQIDHENVTILYEFGYENGQPFMAMQFLQGEDLNVILKEIATDQREPLSLIQKIDVALQICRGLQIAHSRNIVHRDIKPANIKILPDDKVKIMDFGIAKPAKGPLLTASGQQIGTPNYMSPEQVRGVKEIDKRSDIFSFGVLFYELLSLKKPFTGADLYELMQSIVHHNPEKISLPDATFTDALWEVLSKCLQKKATDRYDDFSQVMADLAPIYNRVQADNFLSTEQRSTTGLTVGLDRESVDGSGAPAKKGKKLATLAIFGVLLLVVVFMTVRFAMQGGGGFTPAQIATNAKGALIELKSNASDFGPEFLESGGYLAALQLEQQAGNALQANTYEQAGILFSAAADTLKRAIRSYRDQMDKLQDAADAARNRMFIEKELAQRQGAEDLASSVYREGMRFESRADSNYQMSDLSQMEAAAGLFDLARNKFIEARNETDIRKREQSGAETATARLRVRADAARNDVLAAKLAVPGSESDKSADGDFQKGTQAEIAGDSLRGEGDYSSALQSYDQATNAYNAATKNITTMLKQGAERAKKDLSKAKKEIDLKYQDDSLYGDALQSEKTGEQALGRGDFAKATERFRSGITSLNSLGLKIAQLQADELQMQVQLDAAITSVRKKYSQSLEAGDLNALQSLYKNFTPGEKQKWSQVFDFTKDRDVTIAEDSKTVKGNSAILDLLIKIKYKDNKNRQQELNYAYTWTLEQIDGKWLISNFKEKS